MTGLTSKRPRPNCTVGPTVRIRTAECGTIYVTCNSDEAGPFEVFAHLGKSGGCAKCQIEGITRVATLALRCGTPPQEIVNQLSGLRCPNPTMFPKSERVFSCADAIARIMAEVWDLKYSEIPLSPAQQEAESEEEPRG